jgi:hypothetical protein
VLLSWISAVTLLIDAAKVIDMRLRLIAGGQGTAEEMFLMTSEKLDAWARASAILIRGGNPEQVIEHYQKIVAANVRRLSPLKG